jgi:hypothetical protein
MSMMQKLDVHGKGMEIYPVPEGLLEAYRSEDWDTVTQLINDTRPESSPGYVKIGSRIPNEDLKTKEVTVTNRSFDLVSPGEIKIDRSRFSEKLDDDEANGEVARQVGGDVLDRMLVVHQFGMAKNEVAAQKTPGVTLDYVPEKAKSLVFYDGGTYLIAPGIGGKDQRGKPIDIVDFGGGGTEVNLFRSSRSMMAHSVVHALKLPHASDQHMPRPS